jgi:hypothetical protein
MHRMSLQVRELLSVLVLTAVPYLVWIGPAQSYALYLTNRSVTISTATPSALASHDFEMTLSSTNPVGSIVFQYCDNSPLFDETCTPPAGLSLSGADLSQQTGNNGFSIDTNDTSANRLVISRPPAVPASSQSSYEFDNITNPSLNNQATYVRISTYASTNGSGNSIDYGSVAFSTNTNFNVGAYIPPYLTFCAGVTVADDCSQTNGDSLDLGILSPQATRYATSQYAASTNDSSGCSVYVLGTTMTSGNNIIPALGNQAASRPGAAEFGLNLRRNNSPSVGGDPTGDGASSPNPGYNAADLFSFVPGSQISNSTQSTAYNRMTVSYIVNVPANQPAGVYATTITYLASAQF